MQWNGMQCNDVLHASNIDSMLAHRRAQLHSFVQAESDELIGRAEIVTPQTDGRKNIVTAASETKQM